MYRARIISIFLLFRQWYYVRTKLITVVSRMSSCFKISNLQTIATLFDKLLLSTCLKSLCRLDEKRFLSLPFNGACLMLRAQLYLLLAHLNDHLRAYKALSYVSQFPTVPQQILSFRVTDRSFLPPTQDNTHFNLSRISSMSKLLQ